MTWTPAFLGEDRKSLAGIASRHLLFQLQFGELFDMSDSGKKESSGSRSGVLKSDSIFPLIFLHFNLSIGESRRSIW